MPVTGVMPIAEQKKGSPLKKASLAMDLANALGSIASQASSLKDAQNKGPKLNAGFGTGAMDPSKYSLGEPKVPLSKFGLLNPEDKLYRSFARMKSGG